MNHKWIRGWGVLSLSGVLFAGVPAWASEQVGTLTQIEGDVQVFSHPSKKLQGDAGTHALYEGEYYLVESAKVGAKVEQGNLVRTAPSAKARVVFDNGDQLNVGPGTAMRVFWDKDAAKTQTRLDLAYGKVRGVVEKGGPRGRLQIRTKSATMGVRGTDFFIADGGTEGGTEVSIMRGSVEVTPKGAHSKAVEVKQGFSAAIPAPVMAGATASGKSAVGERNGALKSEAAADAASDGALGAAKSSASAAGDGAKGAVAPIVELRKTTQEELGGIQRASTIEKSADAAATSAATGSAKGESAKSGAESSASAVADQIVKLEQKALETALKDIKTYDPKLYAQLETSKPKSTNEVNAQVVQQLVKEAPRAPDKRKPTKSETDVLDQGAYEKYFKKVE